MKLVQQFIFTILLLSTPICLSGAPSFLGIAPNSNGEYVIKTKCDLKGQRVYAPSNAILRFDGGFITNGTLIGNNTYIYASPCHIFRDVTLEGRFCSTFEVEWVGAIADNSSDNSIAFNKAFSSRAITSWHAGCGNYVIKNAVHITKNISFICDGIIKADHVTQAFVIECHDVSLNLNGLVSIEGRSKSQATAIDIIANSQYNNIFVKYISGFNKGFNLAPRAIKTTKAGISYNVFTWQRITCNECIVFDLDGANDGEGLWISENQFNGGQLEGGVGISQRKKNNNSSLIHGNVFNCVAFENLDYPVKGLYRWRSDYFHDIRMSSGELSEVDYYIEMERCEDVTFELKSKMAAKKIYMKNCISCMVATPDDKLLCGKKNMPDSIKNK